MTTAQAGVNSVHATLSTTTADPVTLTGSGTELRVTNRDATNTLYFTVGTGTAVAAADENFAVLPLQTTRLKVSGRVPVISVVGSGGGYSVELW